ncbi:MAG: hypothetical protein AAFU85_22015, partial [Planctomycetota bacterium]
IAAAVLIPLALLLGFLYSASTVFLPFVKLRALVTFFAGAGLGLIAGTLCYRLKYRSGLFAFLTIFGFTSIAYYTCWAVHPALIGLQRYDLNTADFIATALFGFEPTTIVNWIGHVYGQGLWDLGGGPMKGLWLAVIWLIEFGVIFATSIATGMATYGNKPFCESCNRWNEETEDLAVLPVSTSDPAWSKIRGGDFDALKRLQIVPDQQASYVELRLADCPTCDQSDYLSAIGITLTVDDGELKKNESDIFRHLTVTRAQRDQIVTFAEAMAEAVREMNEAEDESEEPDEGVSQEFSPGESTDAPDRPGDVD